MSFNSKYLFIASMDVDPEKESLFNEVYDQEHVPSLMEVPGVVAIARFKMQDLEMSIGGERKVMKFDNEPKFHAMYEIESPEVLVSDAWGKAVELGRWPEQVRPYTRNRRHILSQRLG
jgi:hypothetical protein